MGNEVDVNKDLDEITSDMCHANAVNDFLTERVGMDFKMDKRHIVRALEYFEKEKSYSLASRFAEHLGDSDRAFSNYRKRMESEEKDEFPLRWAGDYAKKFALKKRLEDKPAEAESLLRQALDYYENALDYTNAGEVISLLGLNDEAKQESYERIVKRAIQIPTLGLNTLDYLVKLLKKERQVEVFESILNFKNAALAAEAVADEKKSKGLIAESKKYYMQAVNDIICSAARQDRDYNLHRMIIKLGDDALARQFDKMYSTLQKGSRLNLEGEIILENKKRKLNNLEKNELDSYLRCNPDLIKELYEGHDRYYNLNLTLDQQILFYDVLMSFNKEDFKLELNKGIINIEDLRDSKTIKIDLNRKQVLYREKPVCIIMRGGKGFSNEGLPENCLFALSVIYSIYNNTIKQVFRD